LKTAHRSTLAAAALLLMALSTGVTAQALGKGQQYYQKICAKCHEAGVGPVLLGRELPEATTLYMVRHGLNAMPAFRLSDIDDATLKDLALYLSKSTAPAKK